MQKYSYNHNPITNPMTEAIQNPYMAKELFRAEMNSHSHTPLF